MSLGQASYLYTFICTSPTWKRRVKGLLYHLLVSKIRAQISQDKWESERELQPPNPPLAHSGFERTCASLNPAFSFGHSCGCSKRKLSPLNQNAPHYWLAEWWQKFHNIYNIYVWMLCVYNTHFRIYLVSNPPFGILHKYWVVIKPCFVRNYSASLLCPERVESCLPSYVWY